jgi:hypothetical protein
LAFPTIPFHLRRSWTCPAHFINFLPGGLPVNGFHMYIFFTILVSGIQFMCPNQRNLWALT